MSELKQRVTLEAYDVTVMLNHPMGTVFEMPDGCLWRVSAAGRSGYNKQVVRMTKRTANGWALKAGEEGFLAAQPEPEVWRKGSLNY